VERIEAYSPDPMRVTRESADRVSQVTDIPELHLPVQSTGHEHQRLVRVEVEIPNILFHASHFMSIRNHFQSNRPLSTEK